MTIRHCETMGRVVSPPATSGYIDFGPGMELPVFGVWIAFLVTADKAAGNASIPADSQEQQCQVAAGDFPLLQRYTRRDWGLFSPAVV